MHDTDEKMPTGGCNPPAGYYTDLFIVREPYTAYSNIAPPLGTTRVQHPLSVAFPAMGLVEFQELRESTLRREKDDFEAKGCPSYGDKPFAKRCRSCGFAYEALAMVGASLNKALAIARGA